MSDTSTKQNSFFPKHTTAFVPALNSFPDCDLIAQVAANSPPMVSFQKEGIQLQITAEILISVVYGGAINGTTQGIIGLGVSINAGGEVPLPRKPQSVLLL
jgi:hypothetical protein